MRTAIAVIVDVKGGSRGVSRAHDHPIFINREFTRLTPRRIRRERVKNSSPCFHLGIRALGSIRSFLLNVILETYLFRFARDYLAGKYFSKTFLFYWDYKMYFSEIIKFKDKKL